MLSYEFVIVTFQMIFTIIISKISSYGLPLFKEFPRFITTKCYNEITCFVFLFSPLCVSSYVKFTITSYFAIIFSKLKSALKAVIFLK